MAKRIRKPLAPPPKMDDSRFARTCTRCYQVRQWVVAACERCGNPEFSVPELLDDGKSED